MIVVADSAPLHYLILLDLADLLPKLYGEVLIPAAVVSELSSDGTPAKIRGWFTVAPGWLRIEPVGPEHSSSVSDALGAGEREAIALAQILQADLLLIDDSDGRFEARRLGLRVTGTLGVLRVAAELRRFVIREGPAGNGFASSMNSWAIMFTTSLMFLIASSLVRPEAAPRGSRARGSRRARRGFPSRPRPAPLRL